MAIQRLFVVLGQEPLSARLHASSEPEFGESTFWEKSRIKADTVGAAMTTDIMVLDA